MMMHAGRTALVVVAATVGIAAGAEYSVPLSRRRRMGGTKDSSGS